MYDMSRVTANGYFDADDNPDARYALRSRLNAQRTEDYREGTYALAGGVVDPLPEDAPQFVKDYYAYYKTERGYHPRSLNSNAGWNVTSSLSFINMPILTYIGEIRSAVLLVHGEKAHSLYFSRTPSNGFRARTRNCSSSPEPTTPTCTTIWTRSLSRPSNSSSTVIFVKTDRLVWTRRR